MKIVIASDGSNCADDALNDLPRTGLPREADALIVRVQERWLSAPSDYETVEEVFVSTNSVAAKPVRVMEEPQSEIGKEHLESLERASQKLSAHFPEWKTETVSLEGSPAREIIHSAKEWNADLIVVGSHGHLESKRFALGSVSQKIANEAACIGSRRARTRLEKRFAESSFNRFGRLCRSLGGSRRNSRANVDYGQ